LDCASSDNLAQIEGKNWPPDTDLLILDEFHKIDRWEQYLKDVCSNKDGFSVIACDSSSFEAFRKDPAHIIKNCVVHKTNPMSLNEIIDNGGEVDFDRMMYRGVFPEAWYAEDDAAVKKWRTSYIDTIMHREIFDFKKFGNFKSLIACFEILKRSVGQPVSFNAISRELGVISSTVQRYVQIFEALNLVFRVLPYPGDGSSLVIARSLTKRPKIYFYDTGLVEGNKEAKFENVMALSLKIECDISNEFKKVPMRLHYVRTKDGLNVDFCVVKNNKLEYLVETRFTDVEPSKNLKYFCWKYDLRGKLIIKNIKNPRRDDDVVAMSGETFCRALD